jgi:hypothetical protein
MMSEIDQGRAAQAMRQYGGAFAKSLAESWLNADPSNRQRVAHAFPEFFDRYLFARLAQDAATERGE